MKTVFTFMAICLAAGFCVAQDTNQQATDAAPQEQAAQQAETADALTEADHMPMMIQQICPVSGQKLGSMGEPLKISVEGETVYVCCANCKDGEINPDHWATIQARRAAAQGVCPIMDKEINAESESALVNGQRVFVCCKKCAAAAPDKAEEVMEKVNACFTSFVAAEITAHSVAAQISAQKICPVSGKELGSMGEPIAIERDGETMFVCCKGCLEADLNAEHVATIRANQAAAQGICPVADKPVDGESVSQVINGRRVFTCCNDCAAKLKNDPESYMAKVEAAYLAAAHGQDQ